LVFFADTEIDLIFLSFPLLVVEIILGNEAVKWGSGVHQWRITAPQFFKQLYVGILFSI